MKLGKVLWGLLVVGAAILLLLMAFNIGIGTEYSAVLIIGSLLLLGIAITSLVKLNFFLFFIPLSVMAYLWKDTPLWTETLGLPEPKIWLLLGAAALLSVGFSIIFHKKGSYHCEVKTDGDWKTEDVLNDNENVNIEASWGEHIKYVHASNLKKARIKSSFASTRVFFDQCQISSEGLEINVNASFLRGRSECSPRLENRQSGQCVCRRSNRSYRSPVGGNCNGHSFWQYEFW